jgi:hypothetical protein
MLKRSGAKLMLASESRRLEVNVENLKGWLWMIAIRGRILVEPVV